MQNGFELELIYKKQMHCLKHNFWGTNLFLIKFIFCNVLKFNWLPHVASIFSEQCKF